MTKLYGWFGWAVIAIVFSAVVVIGIWSIYPYRILEFNKDGQTGRIESFVQNKIVKGGEHLSIKVDYCKYVDMGAEVTISFVDGFIYNTPPVAMNMPVGCHLVTMQIYVPKAIPAGEYKVSTLFRYHPNPIRTIDVTQKTEKFTVIK